MQPLFSLVYTSVRGDYIPHVVASWMSKAADPSQIEWVINTHAGYDPGATAAAEAAAAANPAQVKAVINTARPCCVDGWNNAAAHSTGKIIIAVADDFEPPDNWDVLLLGLKPENWWEQDHAVHVEDGYVHNIMVLAIITRARYARFGYLFYPKYTSMFCDTELTEVAYREGVVIDAHHLLFEHNHPDCGKRQRDHNDIKHASQTNWNTGEMIFNLRRSQGFPIDDGPRAISDAAAPAATVRETADGYAVYMQVIKDDLCLYEVCRRLMDEGCSVFCWAVPDTYWSGERVPEAERATLDPIRARLVAEGATVHVRGFRVSDYRVGNEDRITVETRLRNDSLAWVRGLGFPHVLIVDGDELWLPGTLALVKRFVAEGHVAISVGMIPVIGTPGYPVDSASDVAVVYVGPGTNFRVCRSPVAQQTVIQNPLVIHFTSCRKTMQENVDKHRRSGHYGDPDYAFDDWIEKKLPHAKPGMQHAHMYTRNNIWPVVRHWRPEELATIPESIHPHLGK